MENKNKAVLIGAIGLLIVAGVLVTLFYQGRSGTNDAGPQGEDTTSLTDLPTTTDTGSPNNTNEGTGDSNVKTYTGSGFSLRYPNNWGILTCSNSQNFELDPTSTQDLQSIVCDRAVKPVTVLVTSQLDCQGEKVTLGNNQVTKSKDTDSEGNVDYRWCLSAGGKNFDITHRVSAGGSRATSKDDFSAALEQVISTIQASAQGS